MLLTSRGETAVVENYFGHENYVSNGKNAFYGFPWREYTSSEISALFARNPLAILIMTTPYRGEGPEWAYLIPDTGHHIFFYSEQAFAHVADKYGYDLFRHEDYTLFCKTGSWTKMVRRVLRFRLHPRMVRLYRAVLGYRLANGFARDAQTITEREVQI